MNADLAPLSSAALAAPLSFSPPLANLGEWADIPEKRRTEIRVVLPLLARVHQLVGTGEHSLEAACQMVSAASKHLMRGLSPVSLRRKYEAYIFGGHRPGDIFKEGDSYLPGDWRILVAGYVGPSKQAPEFVKEVKRRANLNNVSMAEAFKQLRDDFAAGNPIPGLGALLPDGTRAEGTWIDWFRRTWPASPLPKTFPRRYPQGWSIRNLRRYGPKRGARMLFQRGLAAAKKHFPSVRRDPSQLRPLELIVIDDFELDCLCVFPGMQLDGAWVKPQIGRVAGLLAIDVATRRKLHWGLGQRLERAEPQADGSIKMVKTGITRVDVQLFLHGLFEKFGLPDYPVTILCEMDRAAASISPELKLSIETLFLGRVRIERTGIFEHKNLANGFCERGGRPWIKGWIEAAFMALWKILGAQKGYKGNNQRINGPADLEEKINYTKLLLGHGEENLTAVQAALGRKHGLELSKGGERLNLTPEVIAKLRLPFQSPQELERAFAWACAVSDMREDHAYVGFDQVTEYLVDGIEEPVPFASLAIVPQEKMLTAKVLTRMETSVERWAKLAPAVHFTAIERSTLAVFLLTPKRGQFMDLAISFKHNGTGYSFVDEANKVLHDVQEGTEFLCYFNPSAPDELHIKQLNGALTGTLQRWCGKRGAVSIKDPEAMRRAAAIQATLVNRAVAENREVMAGEDQAEGEAKVHNAAIVVAHQAETAAMSPVEKLAHAAGESAARAAEQKAAKRVTKSEQDAVAKMLRDAAEGESSQSYI